MRMVLGRSFLKSRVQVGVRGEEKIRGKFGINSVDGEFFMPSISLAGSFIEFILHTKSEHRGEDFYSGFPSLFEFVE